jgi:hypothetical protein
MPPKTLHFIVYARLPKRQVEGILGELDIYTFYFLLAGGKHTIQETYTGTNPEEWYSEFLREQGIIVKESYSTQTKTKTFIWMEVDEAKTPIHEFTQAEDIPEDDLETLGWRRILVPCEKGTVRECLGLMVGAQQSRIEPTTNGLSMAYVLQALLRPDPEPESPALRNGT